jgi:hypothetical protein
MQYRSRTATQNSAIVLFDDARVPITRFLRPVEMHQSMMRAPARLAPHSIPTSLHPMPRAQAPEAQSIRSHELAPFCKSDRFKNGAFRQTMRPLAVNTLAFLRGGLCTDRRGMYIDL